MTRATTFLFLIVCAFPELAFANATSSSKIGISVVIKEKPQCDYHISNSRQTQSSFGTSSNCELKTANLQQYTNQTSITENGLSRIVMTIQ